MSSTSFPRGGRAIIERMTRKFPDLFVNNDEVQRKLTQKVGEQFRFTFGDRWGNKKRQGLADTFRSKDSIAVKEDDGTISVWDMFSSGLDILPNDGDLAAEGTHRNLSPNEHAFMEVDPINWLNDERPPSKPEEPPQNRLVFEQLFERLEQVKANQHMVAQEISVMRGEIVQALHELRQEIAKANGDITAAIRNIS